MQTRRNFSLLPLTAGVLLSVFSGFSPAYASTQRVILESGDNAAAREAARQSHEQWDTTRQLRRKITTRREKEFDKVDRAIDDQDRCRTSANLNAYWEPETRRCLDRRTGRPLMP